MTTMYESNSTITLKFVMGIFPQNRYFQGKKKTLSRNADSLDVEDVEFKFSTLNQNVFFAGNLNMFRDF